MNDIEYSKMRLENILESHKLNYNPFEVSNDELIQTFNTYTWDNSFEITDCVIMEFKELRKCEWINPFDAIVYTLGTSSYEHIISLKRFFDEIVANDSKKKLYTTLDGRPFLSKQQIKSLIGKKIFVSHKLRGIDSWGKSRSAYFMHTLYNEVDKDSKIIRFESYKSKITMLERLLQYPECSDYLFCDKSLFDIETPIRQKIDFIKTFPKIDR